MDFVDAIVMDVASDCVSGVVMKLREIWKRHLRMMSFLGGPATDQSHEAPRWAEMAGIKLQMNFIQ